MDATKKHTYKAAESFIQIYMLTFIFYCFAMSTSFIMNYIENVFDLFDYKKQTSFVLILLIVLRVTINIFLFYNLMILMKENLINFFKVERIEKSSLIFFLTCTAYDTNLALKVNELKRRFDRILQKARHLNITINTSTSKKSNY